MADHGFALIAKIADERTDTNFVVAISAFKLIDLGLNESLKFNSACECAFNAFVHRGNFATDSLAQCGYTITSGGFRLQELESSFRHAARCDMHFLRTADEMCKAPEHDHRQYCASNYANTGGDVKKSLVACRFEKTSGLIALLIATPPAAQSTLIAVVVQ